MHHPHGWECVPLSIGVVTVAPTNFDSVKELQRNKVGCINCWKNEKYFDPKNGTSALVVRQNKIETSLGPNRKGFRSATTDFPYLHSWLLSRSSASRGGRWKSWFSGKFRKIAISAGPQICKPGSKSRRKMSLLTQKSILGTYHMAITAIFRSVKIEKISILEFPWKCAFCGEIAMFASTMSKFGSMFWCYEGIDIGFPIPNLIGLSIPKLGFVKFWFPTPYLDMVSRSIFATFSFMIYCGASGRASEISRGVEISTEIDFSKDFGIWL